MGGVPLINKGNPGKGAYIQWDIQHSISNMLHLVIGQPSGSKYLHFVRKVGVGNVDNLDR